MHTRHVTLALWSRLIVWRKSLGNESRPTVMCTVEYSTGYFPICQHRDSIFPVVNIDVAGYQFDLSYFCFFISFLRNLSSYCKILFKSRGSSSWLQRNSSTKNKYSGIIYTPSYFQTHLTFFHGTQKWNFEELFHAIEHYNSMRIVCVTCRL